MVERAELDRTFQALADGTRRQLIERLAAAPDHEETLSRLAAPFPMSLAAVQKHVRILEEAGMVDTQKRGRSRHVRLRGAPQSAIDWLARYRSFWDARLDTLTRMLEEE